MKIILRFAPALLGFSLIGPAARAALVAHWAFDESPGSTTAVDSVASVNGSLAGSAAIVTGGISGNALSLNGATNTYVTMGNNFGFTSGSFSVVAWIKTTQTTAPDDILSKQHGGTQNGYALAMNSAFTYGVPNKAEFYDGGLPAGTPVSSTTVNDNAWHQVVGVYSSGGNLSLYVDGVFQNSAASVPIVANDAPFMVGGYLDGGTVSLQGNFSGLVDDVQLYNSTLTSDQITAMFQTPGSEAPVPEPSSLGMLAVGSALLLRRVRKPARMASV